MKGLPAEDEMGEEEDVPIQHKARRLWRRRDGADVEEMAILVAIGDGRRSEDKRSAI